MRTAHEKASLLGLARAAVIALLCIGLSACGGSSSDTGGGTVTQPPAAPTRVRIGIGTYTLVDVATAQAAGLPADFTAVHIFTNEAGILEARVNWTNPGNDIDIGILEGDCSAGGTCENLLASAETFAKPEVVQADLPAGDYTLLILNLGPGAESGSTRSS